MNLPGIDQAWLRIVRSGCSRNSHDVYYQLFPIEWTSLIPLKDTIVTYVHQVVDVVLSLDCGHV